MPRVAKFTSATNTVVLTDNGNAHSWKHSGSTKLHLRALMHSFEDPQKPAWILCFRRQRTVGMINHCCNWSLGLNGRDALINGGGRKGEVRRHGKFSAGTEMDRAGTRQGCRPMGDANRPAGNDPGLMGLAVVQVDYTVLCRLLHVGHEGGSRPAVHDSTRSGGNSAARTDVGWEN